MNPQKKISGLSAESSRFPLAGKSYFGSVIHSGRNFDFEAFLSPAGFEVHCFRGPLDRFHKIDPHIRIKIFSRYRFRPFLLKPSPTGTSLLFLTNSPHPKKFAEKIAQGPHRFKIEISPTPRSPLPPQTPKTPRSKNSPP